MGRNANGLIEWKLPNGRTLKGFETEEEISPINLLLPNSLKLIIKSSDAQSSWT